MSRLASELRDVLLALILFFAGLGYAVSGLPSNVVVACVIWGLAWAFLTHLYWIHEWTETCPVDVRIIIWAAITLMLILALWNPIETQYAKEHTLSPRPSSAPAQLTAQPPTPPVSVVRSYLVSDGTIRFGQKKEKDGHLRADQNFQVGDLLSFDYFFKATGPNPVDMTQIVGWLYLELNAEVETQKEMIEDFKEKMGTLGNTTEPVTESPDDGRSHFGSATAMIGEKYRLATQADLDALRDGTEIAFVIAQITYKDNGKTHHLRRCEWLHRPAVVDGAMWESCKRFTKSD